MTRTQTEIRDLLRTAITSASNATIVLDFGTCPGGAWSIVLRLKAEGVRATWDGASVVLPLADLATAGVALLPHAESSDAEMYRRRCERYEQHMADHVPPHLWPELFGQADTHVVAEVVE